MLADRLPYASRIDGGDGGASLADIVADKSPATVQVRRRDLRPIGILAAALCYSVTVGAVSVTVISISGSSGAAVAQACIETGGEWVIGDDGGRECRRGRP